MHKVLRFFKYIYGKIYHKTLIILNLCRFLLNKIEDKTILLIEPNNCHTELFPSFVKYLKDLGYKTEIIAAYKQKANLPKLDVKNIYFFGLFGAKLVLKFKKVKKYDFLIFTSYRLYFANPEKTREYSKIFEHFKISDALKQKTAVTLHHLEDYDEEIKKCLGGIVLTDFLKEKGEKLYVINPSYFKENGIKNKNKTTVFVSIGKLEVIRKNAELLFDGVEKLKSLGITNFRVDVIGDSTKKYVPQHLKDFINPLGRLDFENLYKVLSGADFYLPLLDPGIKEHLRYITDGTSGSFQIIRGFLLPPLLHQAFCAPHGFNSSSALIYDNNDEFLNTLVNAINMQNEEYLNLQNGLLKSRCEIYEKSIKNFKELLGLN